jgi:hypothetical protein
VEAAEGGAELDAHISSRRRAEVGGTGISPTIEAEKTLRRGNAGHSSLVQESYPVSARPEVNATVNVAEDERRLELEHDHILNADIRCASRRRRPPRGSSLSKAAEEVLTASKRWTADAGKIRITTPSLSRRRDWGSSAE